LPWPKP